LGHKQLEENPWDTFENVFPVGSYHEATIVKKDDRGAIVQLPYGLEAFAPIKHIKKDDNTFAGQDEVLTFKVIEFNRDDKRIIVSHTRYLQDIRKEADALLEDEKDQEQKEVKKTIKTTQSKIELSTLGDIEGFSELKEQMAQNLEEASTPKKSKDSDAPKKETPSAEKKDDLKKVEGIGPKIEQLFNEAGIWTYADLSGAEVEQLKEILSAAGSRYQMHDPTSWPEQAGMAARGEWDKLNEWQEQHKGGKVD
jgi:predicted flap endonuclease-1-like 5' DNA nuclease